VFDTLAFADDLSSYPGAPFTADRTEAAVAAVRREAGWHIAPVRTETVTLDSGGGYFLPLPTRKIVSVTAVRDVTSGSPLAVTGWSVRLSGLYLRGWAAWPDGLVEVDLVHGYATTPADLYAVIAARARQMDSQREAGLKQYAISRGPFSESGTVGDGVDVDPALAPYSLFAGIS
jgi:hypothetical protein